MAAYPFQPLSMKKLKQLCRIMKESNHNVDTQSLRKEYNLPDRIISKIIRSSKDKSSNHPQIKNP